MSEFSEVRRKVYLVVFTLGVCIALTLIIAGDITGGYTTEQLDKREHYLLAKIITAAIFLIAYFFSLWRVLLPEEISTPSILWWFPAIIMVCFLVSLGGLFILSLMKEVFDFLGLGMTEWIDIEASLYGAWSLFPAIAVIVSITPFLLPFEITLEIPKKIQRDFQTGFQVLDHFIKTQKYHKQATLSPSILIAEDDIQSATLLLEFFEMWRLPCLHVVTADAALEAIRNHNQELKLVILDNFLRVENSQSRKTGSDILQIITKHYPKRNFKVIVISGYSHMLAEASKLADQVFQKPISMYQLQEYLEKWNII